MNVADYYAVLGVGRRESVQGIQAAYRRLAKRYHPDHAGADGKDQFQAIHQAYEVLSDPAKRKAYDAALDQRSPVSHRSVRPEPFAASPRPTQPGFAEPLISPPAWPEDLCRPASSRRCVWCAAVHRLDLPCPYLQRDEFLESDMDMAQWILHCLRAFHRER
jgi:hypothetical protein